MRKFRTSIAVTMGIVCALAGLASAATIEGTCAAAKNKSAGRLSSCLQAAAGKLASSGDGDAYAESVTKCTTKFADGFSKAEQKAADKGGACSTTGDASAIQAGAEEFGDCVAQALTGEGSSCLRCGNGVLDPGEECDFGQAGTGDCNTATGGGAPLGTVSCGAGCKYDTSACVSCPGTAVGGACWYLGGPNQNCDTVCASHGMVYAEATKTYAGSAGTNVHCEEVLQALGAGSSSATTANGSGLGCWASGSFRVRDLNPTLSSVSANLNRACACQF